MKKLGIRGFTLIELLIVIAIIGILSGVVIVVINPARLQGKARDAVRKKDLSVIKGALEQYYAENNKYPSGITFGGVFGEGSTIYLKSVPNDPLYPDYQYCYSQLGGGYLLCAKVENTDSSNNPGSNCFRGVSSSEAYCVENPF